MDHAEKIHRPRKITVLAILSAIEGVLFILTGEKTDNYFLTITLMMIGFVLVVGAIGLWRWEFWGFVVVLVASVPSLFVGLTSLNPVLLAFALLVLVLLLTERRRSRRAMEGTPPRMAETGGG